MNIENKGRTSHDVFNVSLPINRIFVGFNQVSINHQYLGLKGFSILPQLYYDSQIMALSDLLGRRADDT